MGLEKDQICFEVTEKTRHIAWRQGHVELASSTDAITITWSGPRAGEFTISIPVGEMTSCELVRG